MKTEELSSVLHLCTSVWYNTGKATTHSWDRINSSMRCVVSLAISCGMKWLEDDYRDIQTQNWGQGYWLDTEDMYRLAVMEDNKSAVASIEKAIARKPFICDDVQYPSYPQTFAHKASGAKRGRVFIHARFPWQSEFVKVTSFADDGESFVACSYKTGEESDKIKRRFNITRADIIKDRKQRKAAK